MSARTTPGHIATLASLSLLLFSQARADEVKATNKDDPKTIKIAVMNFKAPGFEAGVVDNLYGLFVSEIDAIPGYQVVSNDEIQAMLGFEAQKNMLGCDDTSCLAEIAGALGVDKLVAGKVGKVGKTFVINITLINQKTARVEKRVVRTVKGEDDVLIQSIMDAAHELVEQKAAASPQAQNDSAPSTPKTQATTTSKAKTAQADNKGQATSNKEQGGSMLPMMLTMGGGAAMLVGAGLGVFSGLQYDSYQKTQDRDEANSLAQQYSILWPSSILVGGLGLLTTGAGAFLLLSGDEE